MNGLLAAWKDLRFTYLTSSLLLALPFALAALAQGFQAGRQTGAGVLAEWVLGAVVTVLHIGLFPLARELYFRATAPIARGLSGFILAGPLLIAHMIGKFLVYVVLNILSIPLGLLGLIILGLKARRPGST